MKVVSKHIGLFVKDFAYLITLSILIKLHSTAKYTYATGSCVNYGGIISNDPDLWYQDEIFYSIARRCLLDLKCHGFSNSFGTNDYYLCSNFIPRPSDSNWEDYVQTSLNFLLDTGV